MIRSAAALAVWLGVLGLAASAQDAGRRVPTVDPDRPDVTNGAHIVAPGLLQIEAGGVFARDAPGQTSSGTPFTARAGVADWLELRAGGDGWLTQSSGAAHASGIGDVQLGAKVRLWSSPDGEPRLAFLPQVNLPTASAETSLGSGSADYLLAVLTGSDVGARGHVDVNYGIGAIGAGGGLPHFVQHEASISASRTVRSKWSPYLELFWISREEPRGPAATSVDGGAIYTISRRIAVDAGAQKGVSRAAADAAAFGGVSFLAGKPRRKSPPPAVHQ